MRGCTLMGRQGIDDETGMLNVFELLPDPGDSVMVVNCGDHFEIRHHKWVAQGVPMMYLTDQDIKELEQGLIVWN